MSQLFAPDRLRRRSIAQHLRLYRIIYACIVAAFAVSANARTRPHYGGVLRVDIDGDPLQKSNGIAWRLLLDGLTRIDSDGVIRPALAARWASEDSDHRWQFWLRPAVSFHNGHPVNALAVVTSLEGSCRATACPWTAVRVLGQSVVFTGDNPMPDLPALLARNEFLIRQSQQSSDIGESQVIGTGPFRFKDATTNSLHLEANDDCWQGRPFVDAIEVVSHRATRDQWMDLSLGNADLAEVHPSDIRQARQQRLNVVVTPSVILLALEVQNADLAPQLRAALAFAVDRAALHQVIFQKQGEVTASMLPATLSGYSFLFPVERDLNRAQALRGGLIPPPLTLTFDGTGAMQLAAERLALNLHDAGFTVRVIPPPANTNIPPHADLVLRSLPVSDGTPGETLNELLRSLGSNTPLALKNAAGTYKAERDFLDRHALIPLLFLPRAWALGSRIRDLSFTSEGIPDLASLSLESAQ